MVFHNSEELEKKILASIERGDHDVLLDDLFSVYNSDISMGTIAPSQLRQNKNIFISTAALCSRAAVKGGLSYDKALSVSDQYIKAAEITEDAGSISPMIGKMMIEYCDLVKSLNKPTQCSKQTLSIITEINKNLYSPLTIETISLAVGRSTSGISHTFKAEMGIPLKSYIIQQKIKEACRMLDRKESSILTVSELLQFSSQSNFQTTFKRIC